MERVRIVFPLREPILADINFDSIILGKTAIHMGTGASINGRLLAQSAITLQSSTIQSNGLGAYQSNYSTVPSTQKRSIRFASSKI